MRQSYDELLMQFHDEMEENVSVHLEPLQRLTACQACTYKFLDLLYGMIRQSPFPGQPETIYCFKHIKPEIYCWLVFEQELYNVVVNTPLGLPEQVRGHYLGELDFIQRYFSQNAAVVDYYRRKGTDMDGVYFVPGAKPNGAYVPDIPHIDPDLNTYMDYTFAKIKAYDLLRDYLVSALDSGTAGAAGPLSRVRHKEASLYWTGDSVNLIELAYGIYATNQINGGDTTLADIVHWLESSLHVNLSRYYRRFEEIRRRKKMSKTRFIDEMRESINLRLDEGNTYTPPGLRKARRTKTTVNQPNKENL